MDRRAIAGRAGGPEDPHGSPRGSRWAVLATAGGGGALAVDAAGRIVTGRNRRSLGWEVVAGARRLVPGAGAVVRQRATGAGGGAPVGLETVLRAGDGDVSQLVYVCLAPTAAAGALGVVDVRNDTSAPVAVTLTLEPGDFWRSDGLWRVQLDGAGMLANGSPALWWERPPAEARATGDAAPRGMPGPTPAGSGHGTSGRARSRRGRAGATMTWPVTHGTSLRVLLPLGEGADGPPAGASVPTLAQVGSGWDRHTAGGLRVDGLPNGRVAAVAAAAVRRLLALDLGAGAPDGPDGRFSPAERALLAAALAVSGFPRGAAEVASLGAARRPETLARMARREAARRTERFGGPAGAVEAMAASAGPTGGWASERNGDDPTYRGAYLLALRDLLVTERPGELDLLAEIGGAVDLRSVRPPVEVHSLGTPWGMLSCALRWHGATPALLWEIVPPAGPLESWAAALAGAGGAQAAPPRISAGALAADWSTSEPTGETLLRAEG